MATVRDAPEGVHSLLDTDLYKLNMQCAILKYFPSVDVEYTFTNRTPHMRLNGAAISWLQGQIDKLEDLRLQESELEYLQRQCKYLHENYLRYLRSFRLRPREQVKITYERESHDEDLIHIKIRVSGLWVETVLYEIPILALTSEAYFKFVDQDWSHDGQEQQAYEKGMHLLEAGCEVSEFGSRRRRDFQTQDLVVRGLVRAAREQRGRPGTIKGTSNVYFAMKHGIEPIGTVAHEWYMAIAAISDDYEKANERGLQYWLECFGEGVLGIALTDTFGTSNFLQAFRKPVSSLDQEAKNDGSDIDRKLLPRTRRHTYAAVYTGLRQDSGDPKDYARQAALFYRSLGIEGKTIIFSDSLNVKKCIEYKTFAEEHGLQPSFGVGTFFTNDFNLKSDPTQKSKPLNIVMKVSKACGNPCVKLSDDVGKNTGDRIKVEDVKARLGYCERGVGAFDEARRW